MNYRDFLQKVIYWVINPLIKAMIKVGLTPNIITFIGFVGNIVAAALFVKSAMQFNDEAINASDNTMAAFQLLGWGGAVILFAGLFEMIDGRLARLGNM